MVNARKLVTFGGFWSAVVVTGILVAYSVISLCHFFVGFYLEPQRSSDKQLEVGKVYLHEVFGCQRKTDTEWLDRNIRMTGMIAGDEKSKDLFNSSQCMWVPLGEGWKVRALYAGSSDKSPIAEVGVYVSWRNLHKDWRGFFQYDDIQDPKDVKNIILFLPVIPDLWRVTKF